MHNKFNLVPTAVEIQEEILSRQFSSFVTSISVLPLILLEKTSEDLNMDSIVASEELRKKMYFGKEYQKTMKNLLAKFDQLGVLDTNF